VVVTHWSPGSPFPWRLCTIRATVASSFPRVISGFSYAIPVVAFVIFFLVEAHKVHAFVDAVRLPECVEARKRVTVFAWDAVFVWMWVVQVAGA